MPINFATGTYVGNGVSDTEISVGFQPNVVFVANVENGDNLDCRTSTMAANTSKDITGVNTIRTDRIRNFTANGFNVGTQNATNALNRDYTWVAFQTDDVHNHVFTYTGDGSDDRVVGSFSFTAGAAMVFGMAAQEVYVATDSMTAGNSYTMDATGGPAIDAIQALGAGSITVGTLCNVNLRVYNVIVWETANKYMKSVSYTGDAADGRLLPHLLGTTPWLSIIRPASTVDAVWRWRTTFVNDQSTRGEATSYAANLIQAVSSTTLNLGTSTGVNASAGSYFTLVLGDGTGGGGGPPGGGGGPRRPPGSGPPNPPGGGSLLGPVLKKMRFPEKVI